MPIVIKNCVRCPRVSAAGSMTYGLRDAILIMPGGIKNLFERLSKSKFRSRFRLSAKDIAYIRDKGMNTIERHARDFITNRLAPAEPKNDGRQTPMRGHPVFVAQHATAVCCRGCLSKWHKIPQHRQLEPGEIDYVVSVLMQWILLQADRSKI